MADIERVNAVIESLKAKAQKAKNDTNVSVAIGYTQAYAIYVHENLEAKHPVGQAKFLEQPMRQLSNDGTFKKILLNAARAKHSIAEGLVLCGLRLQADSQKLCPVDTGALKNSAFTRLEKPAKK
jgi:hypothetical protein